MRDASYSEQTKNMNTVNEKTYNSGKSMDSNESIGPAKSAWSPQSMGKSVEAYEVQIFVVALVYFDLIASVFFFVLRLKDNQAVREIYDTDFESESTLSKLLSSFQSFTLFCFLLEIGALLYAFRMSIFSHYGYCLDIIIISIILYDEIYEMDIFPSRLLGLLRIWRIARLVTTSLEKVYAAHDTTKVNLRNAENQVEKLRMQSEQLQVSNKAEIDSRNKVENMLCAFKDEVETLKEALQIAALEVVRVAEEESRDRSKNNRGGDVLQKFVDKEDEELFDNAEEKAHSSRTVIVRTDGSFE